MPSNLTGVLKHLTTTFTVKDIMTPEKHLVCAPDLQTAPAVSAANPDFSVIPIRSGGVLSGYFERDSRDTRIIEVGDLISDGTNLLDLIGIFEHQAFSFVLTNRSVAGYVHYSDLNHHVMKWTFYVMLEAVERLALDSLQPGDESAYLKGKLKDERFQQVLKSYKRASDNGRSLFTYLNIADILRLAASERTFHLSEESITQMKEVRNWASHAIADLDPDAAVNKLTVVKHECLRLLAGAT
jgi:hypothetical protein